MSDAIPILILAAGSSSRMEGAIKQLLPWGETTLLGNAIEHAKAVGDQVFVVLGANSEEILKTLPQEVNIIQNPEWESGMGSSISKGIQDILVQQKEMEGILIMLADQPLMDSDFLKKLRQLYTRNGPKIAAAQYKNKFGVPAIFHHSLLSELLDLHQDFGARQIINKYSEDVLGLDPKGKEFDVDTKEKYTQLTDKMNFKI
ncbi:nucleotidyltransferase family protein [Flagellimonas allohymeniacidonis]|uniref:Nucleotidyltransferase family protein n=1 Tax=Flagellimonas allohymeniacidonis TaxID=2517819 RepID=A0A4V2HSR8_9FLAO|nr:nucleotidyltransferase family protein [Allomuricauda hymeniacidonis]TAI48790.1 nucleotidyltransferase family protein [Allomuricauda hymeniacidonis]